MTQEQKKLTPEQFAELESIMQTDDRTGFYIKYYEFTACDQALEQAKISSFSGLLGGIAREANLLLKDHPNYPKHDHTGEDGITKFSKDARKFEFEAIKHSYNNGKRSIRDSV